MKRLSFRPGLEVELPRSNHQTCSIAVTVVALAGSCSDLGTYWLAALAIAMAAKGR